MGDISLNTINDGEQDEEEPPGTESEEITEIIIPAIHDLCREGKFGEAYKLARQWIQLSKCPHFIIIYCLVSIKMNKSKAVLEYLHGIDNKLCIKIIDNYLDANFNGFSNANINKHWLITLNFVLHTTVVKMVEDIQTRPIKLYQYLKLIERYLNKTEFKKVLKKLMVLTKTSPNLFVIYDLMKISIFDPNEFLQLKWEVFIRAVTIDLNNYEAFKTLPYDEYELFIQEKKLSNRYLQLAELSYYNIAVQAECLLTAFSLNPTIEVYNLIKGRSSAIKRLRKSKNVKLYKQCCKNLEPNTLCDSCGNLITGTLNDKKGILITDECTEDIFSGKLFGFDDNLDNVNNNNELQELATDLITILGAPRNKLITFELDWKTLNGNLLSLLNTENKIKLIKQYTFYANSQLKFVNLNQSEEIANNNITSPFALSCKNKLDDTSMLHCTESVLYYNNHVFFKLIKAIESKNVNLNWENQLPNTGSKQSKEECGESKEEEKENFNGDILDLDAQYKQIQDQIEGRHLHAGHVSNDVLLGDLDVDKSAMPSDLFHAHSLQSLTGTVDLSDNNINSKLLSDTISDDMAEYERFDGVYSEILKRVNEYNAMENCGDKNDVQSMDQSNSNDVTMTGTNDMVQQREYAGSIISISSSTCDERSESDSDLLSETDGTANDSITTERSGFSDYYTDGNDSVTDSEFLNKIFIPMFPNSSQEKIEIKPTTPPIDVANQSVIISNSIESNLVVGQTNETTTSVNETSVSINKCAAKSTDKLPHTVPVDKVRVQCTEDHALQEINRNTDRTFYPDAVKNSEPITLSDIDDFSFDNEKSETGDHQWPSRRIEKRENLNEVVHDVQYFVNLEFGVQSNNNKSSPGKLNHNDNDSTVPSQNRNKVIKDPKNFNEKLNLLCSSKTVKPDNKTTVTAVNKNNNPRDTKNFNDSTLPSQKCNDNVILSSKTVKADNKTANLPCSSKTVKPDNKTTVTAVNKNNNPRDTKNFNDSTVPSQKCNDNVILSSKTVKADNKTANLPCSSKTVKPDNKTAVTAVNKNNNPRDTNNFNDSTVPSQKRNDNVILSSKTLKADNKTAIVNDKFKVYPDASKILKLKSIENQIKALLNNASTTGITNWTSKKNLFVLITPFIKPCQISLKRIDLSGSSNSTSFKTIEVTNGMEYGFDSFLNFSDTNIQNQFQPYVCMKPLKNDNVNNKNKDMCQLDNNKNLNLKRSYTADDEMSAKRRCPRPMNEINQDDPNQCDSNDNNSEIQFKWSRKTLKTYGRPKNKNFQKEGSYLRKNDKRCITPSSLLINSNIYNSTLNKAKQNSVVINKEQEIEKNDDKNVLKNIPGLKTFEHMKIPSSVCNQTVNIIELSTNNMVAKSTGNSSSLVNVNNNDMTNVTHNPTVSTHELSLRNTSITTSNTISTTTQENTINPSTSGAVFHHFVQFNNNNLNQSKNSTLENAFSANGESAMQQQGNSALLKNNQNIVQFLCKTDGKKIQLTPISNQRISHIQINRVPNNTNISSINSDENVTKSPSESANQTNNSNTKSIVCLPKFNQTFNSRKITLADSTSSSLITQTVSAAATTTIGNAKSLPVLGKVQVSSQNRTSKITGPVRISMPIFQKSNTTSASVSRSIIQLPLRQLNQMSQNLGTQTFPRQVLITTTPARINQFVQKTPPTTQNSYTPTTTTMTTTPTNNSNDVNNEGSKPNTSNSKSLDTSTLEQLREFDMVLEQVKERSISSGGASVKDEPAVKTPATTVAPTSVIQKVNLRNVAFIQQKRGTDASPVVLLTNLCGSDTKNKIVNISTKKIVTNSIKPFTPTPFSSGITVVPKTSSPALQISPNEENVSSTGVGIQKPPQKLQEDEHTVQRIYDILAEYAEKLRNSPDLKNKPAPRRRSNPAINTNCPSTINSTFSNQVSNDNDSSSNSSISTPPAAKRTKISFSINATKSSLSGDDVPHRISSNCENDVNTQMTTASSTVLLISPKKQVITLDEHNTVEDRPSHVVINSSANPNTVTKQIIFSDGGVTKTGGLSVKTSAPKATGLFYQNNCIPINVMKRQQITILSGSKMITVPQQKVANRGEPIILKTYPSPTNSSIQNVVGNKSTENGVNNFTFKTKTINSSTINKTYSHVTHSPMFVLSSHRNLNTLYNNNNNTSDIATITSLNRSNMSSVIENSISDATTMATITCSSSNTLNNSKKNASSIFEKEIKLQKSLSEECQDLGVDQPSTSDLFPEADLLLDANSNSSNAPPLDDCVGQHYISQSSYLSSSSSNDIDMASYDRIKPNKKPNYTAGLRCYNNNHCNKQQLSPSKVSNNLFKC